MNKEGVIALLLLSFLLVLPLLNAQEQVKKYSGFDRFVDNVKMFFSSGDGKTMLALEIREKEVNSAINNFQNGEDEEGVRGLERAISRLQLVQEKVSPNSAEAVNENIEKLTIKLTEAKNLSEKFERYILEEEKTQLTAELTEKTYEYCKKLSQEDYGLFLKEEICNPSTASLGLEKELQELKDIQEKAFVQLMLSIRRCIDDPGTCNCDENSDMIQKAKCEKLVALAVKCEYKDDENSCVELESMKPVPGDGFARSFVPAFLTNLFNDRNDLIEYGLEHSDGVPEECWNENDKSECEKYAKLKEDGLDWDEYGNYIGTQRGKIRATKGIKEPSVPTMEESIPQCFDNESNFLKEKCGKITLVWNEEGLINYIIGNEIDKVIETFENASEQHTIEVRGEEGKNNTVIEVKEEINQINNQIVEITYAAGTGPGGEAGIVIEGDKQKVDVGNSNGDNGLKPEVKTDVAGGDEAYNKDINHETSQNQVVKNEVVEGDGGEGDYAPGTTAGGTNGLAP